jgi:hypothetical protein
LLNDQDMPAVVHDTNENTVDPAAEFLVYIDRTASGAETTTSVAGFDKIHHYQRVQPSLPH